MGADIDIIPVGPGETPEWAIARVYDGPEHVLFMQGWDLDDPDLPPLPEPPPGARPPDPSWRRRVIERLEALDGYTTTVDGDAVVLEPAATGWLVRVFDGYAELEWAPGGDPDATGPTGEQLLDAFRVGPAVFHQPVGGDWWMLDEIGTV